MNRDKIFNFWKYFKKQYLPSFCECRTGFSGLGIGSFGCRNEGRCHSAWKHGAGNDQIRFDLIFQTICPSIEIITPIRDLALSREDEITYLQYHGVQGLWEKAMYSINKGLWGTSIGGRETLTSHEALPEEAFPNQLQKN